MYSCSFLEKYLCQLVLGGSFLNKLGRSISSLSDEKIFISIGQMIDNELLFPITSLMIWKHSTRDARPQDYPLLKTGRRRSLEALVRPELVKLLNSQSRWQKLGGPAILHFPKSWWFISSKIIKMLLCGHSHIKVFWICATLPDPLDKNQS